MTSCGGDLPPEGAYCVSAREAAYWTGRAYDTVACLGPRGCYLSTIEDSGRVKTVGVICDRRPFTDASTE